MKIKKVVIDNFRNIQHAEYELGDRNIFAGPNYEGKTNTLLAIYWLINGYLLDGSSDDESNKPNMSDDDKKKLVSVELTFDNDWSVKKEYQENWVKNRGTKGIVLQGNTTQYYINGDKTNVKEAKLELTKRLGLNKHLETSTFDLNRAVTDPYYMGLNCDWKTLRAFIIELVGDVSNDNVYESDPSLLNVKQLLTKYDHDTSKVVKHLKSSIKNLVEEIDTKQKGIIGFDEIKDVEKEELFNAEAMIEQIDSNISSYKQQLITSVNPNIQTLENEKAEVQLKLSEQITADQKHLEELNATTKIEITNAELALNKANEEKQKLTLEKNSKEQEKRTYYAELTQLKSSFQLLQSKLEGFREEYKEIVKDAYVPSPLPGADTCPHCGGLLNESHIESINKLNKDSELLFNERKAKKIEQNIASGKALSLDMSNIKLQIAEKEALEINFDVSQYDKKIEEADSQIQIADVALFTVKGKLVMEYVSEETKVLRTSLNDLITRVDEEKKVDTTSAIETKIAECQERKKPHIELISKHNLYLTSQKKIDELNKEIDKITNSQCDFENQLVLVEKFIQNKLAMLKGHVEKVFGTEVTFTLVETNIKEGSWNEVCYPSVLGKKSAFSKGSGSEKIITGIYLIECVKKAMNLPDVPILFDECDKLDTQSLATRLNTNSQIIATKVDDINYKKLTLIQA